MKFYICNLFEVIVYKMFGRLSIMKNWVGFILFNGIVKYKKYCGIKFVYMKKKINMYKCGF